MISALDAWINKLETLVTKCNIRDKLQYTNSSCSNQPQDEQYVHVTPLPFYFKSHKIDT